MTSTKGATPALRLTLPGAPNEWHQLGGIDGSYRPDMAVPISLVGISEDDAKRLDKDKHVPLTLEQASPADADAAADAYLDHTGDAAQGKTRSDVEANAPTGDLTADAPAPAKPKEG